jgi:PAS domain S-box-containing protein
MKTDTGKSPAFRVLVIEDDPPTRKLLQTTIKHRGHHVTTCPDIKTAWKTFRARRIRRYELIILDLVLPDGDGLDLCRQIRSRPYGKQCFILVVTARDKPEDLQAVIEAGADDYIAKPLDIARLNVRLTIAEEKLHQVLEKEQVAAALLDSEERYRTVTNTISDAIITIDEKSKIVFANPAVEHIFGYSNDELLGQSLTLLMPRSQRRKHRVGMRKYLNNKQKKLHWEAVEFTGLRKDGSEFPLEISFKEYIENGKHFFTGVLRDITRRKQTETALTENNARLQLLQQVTTAVHSTLDLNRVFKQITDGIIHTLGYTTALILTRDEESGTFRFNVISSRQSRPSIEKILGFRLSRLSIPMDPPLNPTIKACLDGQLVVAKTLAEIAYPLINKKTCDRLQALRKGKTYLLVPLKLESVVVGGILISSPEEEIAEEDLTSLATFANVASQAIANASLYRQTEQTRDLLKTRNEQIQQLLQCERKRIDQIQGLMEVTSRIRVGMTESEIFKRIAQVINTKLGWQTVVITKCDPDFKNSRFITGIGLPSEELARLKQTARQRQSSNPGFKERFLRPEFRLSRSYFIPEESGGAALLEEANVYVCDPQDYAPGEWKPGDFLFVPIVDRHNQTSGLITVDRPVDGKRPSVETVRILEMFADQVAIAMENQALYRKAEQQARRATSLVEVTSAINAATKIDELLNLIVEKVLELTKSNYGGLFLWDEHDGLLRLRSSRGVPDNMLSNFTFKSGESIAGKVFESGQGLFIQSREECSHLEFSDHRQRVSLITLPLVTQNRVLGVLGIDRLEGEAPFTEEEYQIAQDFAEQAALALEKVRLIEAGTKKVTQLNVIFKVAEYVSSILDPVQLLEEAARTIQKTFHYELVNIRLVDPEQNILYLAAVSSAYGERFELSPRLELGKGLSGWAAVHNQPVFVNDVRKDDRYFLSDEELQNIQSELVVPIQSSGKVLGTLDIESERLNAFDQEDLSTMQSLADHLAIALENARLFKETQQRNLRLQKLNELSIMLVGDTQNIFDRIVTMVAEVFTVPVVTIEEITEDKLVTRAQYVQGKNLRGGIASLKRTPYEKVQLRKKPYYHQRVRKTFPVFKFSQDLQIQTFLGVPVLERGKEVIGILSIMDSKRRSFTTEDQELLQTFAHRIYFELAEERRQRERAKIQKALEESEERYRELVENSILGLAIYIPGKPYLFANRRLSEITGYAITEIQAPDFDLGNLLPAKERETFQSQLRARLAGKQVPTTTYSLKTKENRQKWAEIEIVLFQYLDQPAVQIQILDVTERIRVEKEQEAFRNLTQKLLHPLDMRETGKILAEASRNLFDHDAFYLDMIDSENRLRIGIYNEDTPVGKTNPVEFPVTSEPLDNIVNKDVYINGQPKLMNRWEEPTGTGHRPFGVISRLSRSLMFAPVLWEGQTIGVLSVQSYTPGKYTEADLNLLRSFADQCSGALARARVEESLRRHLEQTHLLRDIVETLNNTTKLEDVFSVAIDGITKVMGTERASILLLDPDGVVRFKAWKGISSEYREAVSGHFPWEQDNVSAEPILVTDVRKAEFTKEVQQALIKEKIHACVFFPLTGTDKLLGKFMTYYPQPRTFTQDEIHLARMLADSLSAAIERVKSREALQKSEEKYRRVVENIHETIYSVTFQEDPMISTPELVAGQTERITGYRPTDFIQNPGLWFSLIHPEDREQVVEFTRQLITRKEPVTRHYRLRHKSSNLYYWIEDNVVPSIDEEGNVVGYFGVARDISRRKQAEEKIQAAKERYQRLFDGAPIMYVLTDEKDGQMTIVDCNKLFLKTLGYQREDVIGRPVVDFYTQECRERVAGVYEEIFQEKFQPVERQLVTRTGRVITALLHAVPEVDARGRVVGTLVAYVNISERKQLEEFNESILKNMAEGLAVLDKEGRFVYLNPAAEALLGYQPGELVGKHWSVTAPDDQHHIVAQADERRAQGISDSYELVLVRKDGKRIHTRVSGSPRFEGNQFVGTTAIFSDVSAQKQQAEILASINDIAEKIQLVLTPEEIYTTLATELKRLGLYSMIFRFSRDRKQARPVHISYPRRTIARMEKILGQPLEELRIKLARISDMENAFGNRPPLILNQSNLHTIKQFFPQYSPAVVNQLLKALKIKEMVYLPLTQDKNTVGVILILASKSLASYLPALPILAAHISSALQNANLFTRVKESEVKYRSLFESSPVGIAVHQQGRVVFANPTAVKMFGYHSQQEFIGKKVLDFVHPDYQKSVKERIKRLLTHPGTVAEIQEEKFIRKDGTPIDVTVTAQSILYDNEPAIQVFFVDITDRVRQEEVNRRLFTAVTQAAESIVITDPEGIIEFVNPAFERITGYSKDEVIGENMRIHQSGEENQAEYQVMWDTLKRGEVWTKRIINRKKDGTLYEEETTITPVRDSQGNIVNYVSVGRDVTQEVALEEQLRQSQKLEAIGRLAGGISHDFNNILTGIIGYADLSLSSLPPDHPLRDNLTMIIKKSDDAAILIRQLLAFSRKQILDLQQLDLNHVVTQSTHFLSRVIRDDIKMVTRLDKTPCIIEADPTALQQIITNLCVNAQDAMPQGGQITITTEMVTLDEKAVRSLPETPPGEYVKLSVQDTGSGIEPEVREHIFEPFFTTKAVGKGTGLGLATVYGLVKQHKGTIQCYTRLNEGTVFELYFPVTHKTYVQSEQTTVKPALGGKETILIIEDDIDVLNVLKNILDQAGYDTMTAKDGADGLKILKNKGRKIDLVITDIYMPKMSGVELYRQTRALRIPARFLFISGYTKQATLEPGMEYLQKPFSSNQLTQKIRSLLEA